MLKIGLLGRALLDRKIVSSNPEVRSIHSMEVKHENRVENEKLRRDAMNDGNLRHDLEKQYGITRWAKKLIDEILAMRTRTRAAGGTYFTRNSRTD